jgi:hypothetical protein
MITFIRKILAHTVSTKFGVKAGLAELDLQPLTFVRPTVDGQTVLKLEKLSHGHTDWQHASEMGNELQPVRDAINNLIQVQTSETDSFDFKTIQSISGSKSLMHGSASHYKDALAWGQAMYADDRIDFVSEAHFEKNLQHVKARALNNQGKAIIYVYEWHYNRTYICIQDGAHHSVALIRQMAEQDRAFTCSATVTRYSINPNCIDGLSTDFHLVIADNKYNQNDGQCELNFELHLLKIRFAFINIAREHKAYSLYAIPKRQPDAFDSDVDTWIKQNIATKKMISLFELIDSPSTTLDEYAMEYGEDRKALR